MNHGIYTVSGTLSKNLCHSSAAAWCPGAILESIAVGSIPVIFNDDLAFFNESRFGKELLQNLIVWKGVIDQSLFMHLDRLPKIEVEKKQKKLMMLYDSIEKYNFYNAA
jgi:hypothetical protein